MMGAPELLALSLGLSVGVAALSWVGGRMVERVSADPVLRDRVWAAALMAPALPPLLVGAILLTPPPVRDVALTVGETVVAAAPARSAAPAAVAASPVALDAVWIAWSVLALAGALALFRLASLTLRAARLGGLIRRSAGADQALVGAVEAAAKELKVVAPFVMLSDEAAEPLLSGLGRARLILPRRLADAVRDRIGRAVIGHELAHLKRGDHRALWLEEGLLAVLAINPLMAPLRSRRAAAREEACDALALAGAAPEMRRAYAQTLIEALRTRAEPPGWGVLPALTFTGAARSTGMHRLKAVVAPAAPAGRKPRLLALGVGALALALAGAGSAAVAAQREPTLRGFQPLILTVNGERVYGAEILPTFRWVADAVHMSEGPGPRRVDLSIRPAPDAPPLRVNGVVFPAGVTTEIVHRDDVARIETLPGGEVNIVLKQTAPLVRSAPDAAAARDALSPDQRARYRRVSAQGYRDLCASDEPADDGFCSGVMFAQMNTAGVCAPAEALATDTDNGAALGAYVARGRAVLTRLSPRRDEGAHEYANRAMAQAYPCDGESPRPTALRTPGVQADEVVAWVPVDLDGPAATLAADEHLRVALVDADGVTRAETLAAGGTAGAVSGARYPLTRAEFPGIGQGNRVYSLVGEIRGGDGAVRRTAEPVIVRLAPGSQSLRGMTATLTFKP